ncbi:MAG: hypothetical protein P4L86_13095, partial [Mycobacterium sp.]|nr:hypothetical protein [Mycobacterium sp.]
AFYYGQDATCDYATGNSPNTGTLTSPSITGITAQSTLGFSYYLGTEGTPGYDTATVYVIAGGVPTALQTLTTNDTSWHTVTGISLAQFAGQTIQIQFTFNTVDQYANNFKGWLVDDVIVSAAAATPDLTIAKSHTGNFTQGQVGATYTITVSNSGTGPTSGTVTVTDPMPAGLTATAASGSGWTCTVTPAPVSCNRSDALAAGNSYLPITLTVTVAANATSLTNTATVAGGGETNTSNDTASNPTTINPPATPDLTIAKTHTGNFTQGQVGATYTITVTNSGTGPTTGTVTVTDPVPTGLTATAASGSGWSCTITPAPVSCNRSDALAAGSSYLPITLTVTVAANATNLTNTATVAGGGETNTSNDTASNPTSINPPATPDLTIAKTHTGNFTQGQVGATYTITVTNSGTGPTSGTVTVTDPVPTGLTATAASGSGWTCTVTPAPVSCNRSDALAAGNSYLP